MRGFGMQRLAIGLLVAILSLAGTLPTVRRAIAAADDVNISYQGLTTQQSLGISPDGVRLCAVWTQFDLPDPQVFFRLYNTNARAWNPPLNLPPFQVSTAGNANRPRCAIDAANNTHVVWQQKHRDGGAVTGQLDVAYRRLPPDGNAIDQGAWSGIDTLAENRSAVDIDVVENAPDGKAWIVYRSFREGGASELELRSWEPGRGWDGPRTINTGGAADAPRLAADTQGFVHVAFRNGGSSGISYVALTPGGGFGPRLSVPNGTNAGAADIAVDRGNGDVHIVYAKEFTKLFYARKSYNGDFSLAQIDEGDGQIDDPGIAWSANGQLTVGYNNGKGREVALQSSTDGGRSWSGRSTFTNPDGGISAPWTVADRNGGAYVAYNRRKVGEVFFATTGGPAPAPTPAPAPSRPPASAPSPPDVSSEPLPACFAETGQCVRGLFLAYWRANGGLTVNGYPLTEEFPAYLEDEGAYTVQYFERVRLEYHPEAPPPNNVQLGQFGRAIRAVEPPVAAIPGAPYYDPVTGHNVTRPEFAAFYAANGGLAQFGRPLGEETDETLPNAQGVPTSYRVQYFERARLEWHPESFDPRFRVQLGQFGRRILEERGR